jgi:hypothetical protein
VTDDELEAHGAGTRVLWVVRAWGPRGPWFLDATMGTILCVEVHSPSAPDFRPVLTIVANEDRAMSARRFQRSRGYGSFVCGAWALCFDPPKHAPMLTNRDFCGVCHGSLDDMALTPWCIGRPLPMRPSRPFALPRMGEL